MPRRRGLLRTAARTAVVAGTATSVAGRVQRRQQQKFAAQANRAAPTAALEAGPAASSANGLDIVGSLQRLAELKASGALSEKEYAAAKARVLAM
jgi:hypothetical protein